MKMSHQIERFKLNDRKTARNVERTTPRQISRLTAVGSGQFL